MSCALRQVHSTQRRLKTPGRFDERGLRTYDGPRTPRETSRSRAVATVVTRSQEIPSPVLLPSASRFLSVPALGLGSSGLDPRELDDSTVHRRRRCKSESDRRPTRCGARRSATPTWVKMERLHRVRMIDRPERAGSLGRLQSRVPRLKAPLFAGEITFNLIQPASDRGEGGRSQRLPGAIRLKHQRPQSKQQHDRTGHLAHDRDPPQKR